MILKDRRHEVYKKLTDPYTRAAFVFPLYTEITAVQYNKT